MNNIENVQKTDDQTTMLQVTNGAITNPTQQKFVSIMQKYHSGDKKRITEAKEEADEEMKNFVSYIMWLHFKPYEKYQEELIQEGRTAVIAALPKYDITKGAPSTFFFSIIYEAMQKFIASFVNKRSPYYTTNDKKIQDAIQFFEEKGLPYTEREIAYKAGLTYDQVLNSQKVKNATDEMSFLSEEFFEDSIIQKVETPEQIAIRDELIEGLYAAIKRLNKMEIAVICFGYEFMPKETIAAMLNKAILEIEEENNDVVSSDRITNQKIAKALDISVDAVKATKRKAIDKLRNDKSLQALYTDYNKREVENIIEEKEIELLTSPIEYEIA